VRDRLDVAAASSLISAPHDPYPHCAQVAIFSDPNFSAWVISMTTAIEGKRVIITGAGSGMGEGYRAVDERRAIKTLLTP
jgi:hypothetical protein